MSIYIHHLETLVPEHAYAQEYAREKMESWVGNPAGARRVRQIYRRSGIERRHSVLDDFAPGAAPSLFRTTSESRLIEPSTEERNRHYIRAANRMTAELARRTLQNAVGFAAQDITHVITVSCTGFYNPGPDYTIVTALGLPGTTERYHLGFMGCYGAFPALRMAEQFCRANPEAVILVLCLELCTLHLQIKPDADTLLANALFADGAAAALVSGRPPTGCQPSLAMARFLSALAPDGGRDMAWEIGNQGFNLVLSSYVPDVIAAHVGPIMDDLLRRAGRTRAEIDLWAIHPGGRAIVDKIERALGLRPEQVRAARETLRDYGNMSSATILFVLKRLLKTAGETSQRVCAMAFGPGLVIETALLELVPARLGSPADGIPVQAEAPVAA